MSDPPRKPVPLPRRIALYTMKTSIIAGGVLSVTYLLSAFEFWRPLHTALGVSIAVTALSAVAVWICAAREKKQCNP